MWELDHKESWVPKNWCLWTVVLGKTLESPWPASRSNQSILKEISPEHSLEGLMLKLKLQYFGHLMQRTDSLEKTLMKGLWRLKAGGEGDDRGWDGWMASLTQWTWVWASSGSWWWTGKPSMLQSMESQRDTTEWLNWLIYVWRISLYCLFSPGLLPSNPLSFPSSETVFTSPSPHFQLPASCNRFFALNSPSQPPFSVKDSPSPLFSGLTCGSP